MPFRCNSLRRSTPAGKSHGNSNDKIRYVIRHPQYINFWDKGLTQLVSFPVKGFTSFSLLENWSGPFHAIKFYCLAVWPLFPIILSLLSYHSFSSFSLMKLVRAFSCNQVLLPRPAAARPFSVPAMAWVRVGAGESSCCSVARRRSLSEHVAGRIEEVVKISTDLSTVVEI